MKRINSKSALLKRRVKTIQNRAKFVGMFYLLGSLALLALAACVSMLNGTVLAADSAFPAIALPVLSFYKPFVAVFEGGIKAVTADEVVNAAVALLYAIMLLVMFINVLVSFTKLGWLFKIRASYTNGFNRNMYAMDDMGKRFSSSFAALIICYLQIYLLSAAPSLTMFAYIALAAGFFFHFLCGLIGGRVTLFTTGEDVQEEVREFGLFTYFVRNLFQIAAVGAILYFIVPQSNLRATVYDLLTHDAAWITSNVMNFVPAAVQIVVGLFLFILIKHATAATEFNRDCMDGAGMHNFAVFVFFAFLGLGAYVVLPYLNIPQGVTAALNTNVLIAAGIAFVSFLLDCIIKSRPKAEAKGFSDELDMEAYFQSGPTII